MATDTVGIIALMNVLATVYKGGRWRALPPVTLAYSGILLAVAAATGAGVVNFRALVLDDALVASLRPLQLGGYEVSRVRGVLAEWDDLEAYLPRVNAAGSRAPSYRDESPHGHTCVGFLGLPHSSPAFAEELASLRAAVDEALPGCYAWLAEGSLHVTVRALDP